MAILPILVERRCEPAYVNTIEDGGELSQPEPWFQEIVNIIAKREYPANATPREKDTLRRLASTYILDKGELLKMTMLPVHIEHLSEPIYINDIEDENEQPQPRPEPWYQKIVNYKIGGEYPPNFNKREKRALLRQASQYILGNGDLLKKTPHGIPLRCVDAQEGHRIIQDVHEGDCGTHMNACMLCKKILRLH